MSFHLGKTVIGALENGVSRHADLLVKIKGSEIDPTTSLSNTGGFDAPRPASSLGGLGRTAADPQPRRPGRRRVRRARHGPHGFDVPDPDLGQPIVNGLPPPIAGVPTLGDGTEFRITTPAVGDGTVDMTGGLRRSRFPRRGR